MDEARRTNLENWNDRVPIHLGSDVYEVNRFNEEPDYLSPFVRRDVEAMGDVAGKSLLHLQCHIGTDTLSWARMGAEVTGVDFSAAAIEAALELSRRCGTPGRFVRSELYETPRVLPETFDIVITGIGALCWLPDIAGWGRVVGAMLREGGTFYVRDAHPVMGALDWTAPAGTLALIHPYFEAGGAVVEDEPHTYAGEGTLTHTQTHTFNHGLGEIVNALISAGLRIEFLKEHTACDWQGLEQLAQSPDGQWRLQEDLKHRAPLMFSIRARKG